jgi:RNA polymerase sigma factor (sigma-70 family)
MSTEGALCVGIARPVPDAQDFVTPIFISQHGPYVAQCVRDDRIIGFQEIDIGEEFAPLPLHQYARLGDHAMYGVELGGCVSVGSSLSIHSFLSSRESEIARRLKSVLTRYVRAKKRDLVGEFVAVMQPTPPMTFTHHQFSVAAPVLSPPRGPRLLRTVKNDPAPLPKIPVDATMQVIPILTGATSEDPTAFNEKVYFEIYPRLIAQLKVRFPEFAHDAAQETFLIIREGNVRLSEKNDPQRYVFQVALNEARRLTRQSTGSYRLLVDTSFVAACADQIAEGFADSLICAEDLEKAFSLLPELERRVFELKVLHALPTRASCKLLNVSQDRAERALAKARRSIMEFLLTK